jgi:hypothetical protein
MSEKIYFQWQNENLLRTIYPLREMKLRDFLIHYHEIDTWATYKKKSIEELSDEVETFKQSQTALVTSLQSEYEQGLTYFQGSQIDFDPEDLAAADPVILDKLRQEHANFNRFFLDYDSAAKQRIYLDRFSKRIEDLRQRSILAETARLERNIRNVPQSTRVPEWKQTIEVLKKTLPIVETEQNRLFGFSALFKKIQSQKDELDKWVAEKQRERTKIENEMRWKRNFTINYPTNSRTPEFEADLRRLEARLEQLNLLIQQGLTASIEDRLKDQIERQNVTVNDLARWKTEQFQQELEQFDHQQLLEAIVRRFLAEPTRYPLWVQYMVIHFSGMRYRSAHGSWGDPKDLLLSLKIKDIEVEIKQMSDADILSACARQAGILRSTLDPESDNGGLDAHIERLESQNPYRRRRAWLDFRIDQEKINLENLNEQETLDALEALKDQLPEWMWKEIVARTDLRLKFATVKWEELTPEERSQYLDRESAVFREIMIEWERKNLTGWREEHDETSHLIVTRAVCNEVAEHIQHLRGHSPPGGLTAKPSWYLRLQKVTSSDPDAEKAYLIKPSSAEDFEEGASILWLRWVKDYPNPWRIAHPLTLANGEGLLSSSALSGPSVNVRKAFGKQIRKEKGNTSPWVYEDKGDAYRRSRIRIEEVPVNPKSKSKKTTRLIPAIQQEWLRWMHEATVAEVAETADGPVVLTFETALPYDDPRRSTIGIFKRSARDLRYFMTGRSFNGTFVGYVPEGALPIDNLHEMLDWNHILLKDLVSPAEMQAFWAQVTPTQEEPDPS